MDPISIKSDWGCGSACVCWDEFRFIKYRFNSFFISSALVLLALMLLAPLLALAVSAFASVPAFASSESATWSRSSLNNASYLCWGRFTMSFILGTVNVSLKKEYKLCITKIIMRETTETWMNQSICASAKLCRHSFYEFKTYVPTTKTAGK